MAAHVVAKMLYVGQNQVERLFPIHNSEGVTLTYFIGIDGKNVGVVKRRLKQKIDDRHANQGLWRWSIFVLTI